MHDLIKKNLAKLVTMGSQGLFPFPLQPEAYEAEERWIEASLVVSQLVYTEKTHALSFLILDLNSLVRVGKRLFPDMEKKEGLKMAVSAYEELINSASAKIGTLLAKLEDQKEAVITPPIVSNFSGENRFKVACRDSGFLKLKHEGTAVDYIVTVQSL